MSVSGPPLDLVLIVGRRTLCCRLLCVVLRAFSGVAGTWRGVPVWSYKENMCVCLLACLPVCLSAVSVCLCLSVLLTVRMHARMRRCSKNPFLGGEAPHGF